MPKATTKIIFTLGATLLVIVLSSAFRSNEATTAMSHGNRMSQVSQLHVRVNRSPMHQASTSWPQGLPAIVPHTNSASGGAIGITASDAVTYISGHGFQGGPLANGGKFTVLRAAIMPASTGSTLTQGASMQRPDDYPIVYVQLQGPFLLSNVPLPSGATPEVANTVHEVFDANTGNLLLIGFP